MRSQQIRGAVARTAAKGKRVALGGDARNNLMRTALYDRSVARTVPPVGPAEQDRRLFIERTWAVEKKREALDTLQKLRRRYERVHAAMTALERLDAALFSGAQNQPSDLVFPRTLGIPTLTPSRAGFPAFPNPSVKSDTS